MTVTLREGQVRVADDATAARTLRWPGLFAAALGLETYLAEVVWAGRRSRLRPS